MKISDAATKGRELLEPRQGNDLFMPDEGQEKYGGCYRGMCLVGAGAVGLPITDANSEDWEEGFDLTDVMLLEWPWVGGKRSNTPLYVHPCTCTMTDVDGEPAKFTVAHILAHLWDKHVALPVDTSAEANIEALDDPWMFERITDWLRSIEPAD